MNWKKRLSEPSTWAGFSGVLLGMSSIFPTERAQGIVHGLSIIASSIAVFMGEGGHDSAP